MVFNAGVFKILESKQSEARKCRENQAGFLVSSGSAISSGFSEHLPLKGNFLPHRHRGFRNDQPGDAAMQLADRRA